LSPVIIAHMPMGGLSESTSSGRINNHSDKYHTVSSICVINSILFIPYIYKCHINLIT
jgi:hypothetical protein